MLRKKKQEWNFATDANRASIYLHYVQHRALKFITQANKRSVA